MLDLIKIFFTRKRKINKLVLKKSAQEFITHNLENDKVLVDSLNIDDVSSVAKVIDRLGVTKLYIESVQKQTDSFLQIWKGMDNDLTEEFISESVRLFGKIQKKFKSKIAEFTDFDKIIPELEKNIEGVRLTYSYANDVKELYFDDEYGWYLSNRDAVHYIYEFLDKNKVFMDSVTKQIRSLDAEVQKIARNRNFDFKPYGYAVRPKSHWWWYLHEIDKLSEKDLGTV